MVTKTPILSCLILALIIALSIVNIAFAQFESFSGVSVGETFTYSNTYIWNSTVPSDIVPVTLLPLNQSQVKITIQTVTGSTIQHEDVWTYRNGTATPPSIVIDEVNNHLTPNTIFIYAANLSVGGLLFPGATDLPFIINDTTFRAYPDGVRQTNHIAVNNTGIEGTLYSFMNLYFDRQTGMLVEYYLTTVYSAFPSQMTTQHLLLTDSSVWTISSNTSPSTSALPAASPTSALTPAPSQTASSNSAESPPFALIITIAVVAVVIIVAGFLLLRKSKPKQEPSKSSPSEESSYSI